MHPYHHALSSQRRHGGETIDYLPLHNWFDASKSTQAHFTHRALRHHRGGVAEAVRLFADTIYNADNAAISVETLGYQHLTEDLGILASAADWLRHLEFPASGPALLPSAPVPPAEELASASARKFETTADAVLPLHCWFLETQTWFGDSRHLAMRHHSFGIFEAEQRFGLILAASAVPTRIIAEWHVRAILGRIPATTDFLRRIKGQPWMAAARKPAQSAA
jgi:hypothetical protein